MNADIDAILAQIRQKLIEQSAAPAQQKMEQISVTGQRPQASQQDPIQMFMAPPQMPNLGGLSGMPVTGMGAESYNPFYKQTTSGGPQGEKNFLNNPSIANLMGK